MDFNARQFFGPFRAVLLGAFLLLAFDVHAQVRSAQCQSLYVDYKKRIPVKAFAVSPDRKSCGASWGNESVALAKKIAIRECTKSSEKPGCMVVENDKPATKPNSDKCSRDLARWRREPGSRAFALSGNGTGCGWAYGFSNLASAKTTAIQSCEGGADGCHIIETAN